MIFQNAAQFSLHIEQVATEKKTSYMEAILAYCEENFIEPDEIKHLVNKPLRDKLYIDMQDADLLPKVSSVDITSL